MTDKGKTAHTNADNWRAIRALNGYRWLVAVTASALFISGKANMVFNIMWPALFGSACSVYLALCLVSAWASYRPKVSLPRQIYLLIGTDILFVLALVTASSGISDGLAVLLIAPIAGASTLVRPRIAALFAALASLGLLGQVTWRMLHFENADAEWVSAGLLGVLLFVVAIVASVLSRQAHTSAKLASLRAAELSDMTRLNEQIIQQMAVGVLVVDGQHCIRMSNQAARTLLARPQIGEREHLTAAAPELEHILEAWQTNHHQPIEPFAADGHRLIPRFDQIDRGTATWVLIYLDDARRLNEQAQQIKLASLGRLTASIAHEIRNPLSAINHSAQLLDESSNIGDDEQHLLAIVQRHAGRIDDIVKNVLGLSRRRSAAPEWVTLATWLPEFIARYCEGRSNPPSLMRNPATPNIQINVDPAQLEQILTIICDNAERHSVPGTGQIRIQLSAGQTQSHQPYLDIHDNGPGIPDETAEQLMEPFYTTSQDGTGLGLYIARELCEANSATLTLASSQTGACFRIQFNATNPNP